MLLQCIQLLSAANFPQFSIYVSDTSLANPQKDPLQILEQWKKVFMIDEDELVCLAVDTKS